MKKTLASRLNNRIEIWRNLKIETKLGSSNEPSLLKNIWADIVPLSGKLSTGEANTSYSERSFKIIIRKIDIKQSDFIIFRKKRFDIDYIIPDFNSNSFLEIKATLRIE